MATASVDEYQEFKTFVLRCAVVFGPVVLNQDLGPDGTIPEVFNPSEFYLEHLADSQVALAAVEAWTLEDAAAHQTVQYGSEQQRQEVLAESRQAMLKKKQEAEAMLALVEAWTPPTSEHQGLKRYMQDLLKKRIVPMNFDTPPERPILPPEEYRAQVIQRHKDDLAEAERALAEELELCRQRTQWVQQLKTSLCAMPGYSKKDNTCQM